MGGVVALTGNPNTGKTTIFNALTGSSQRVGNWPGVTVERKEGRLRYGNEDLRIVDLPGIYSLSVSSIDEQVAAEFLLKDKPELAVVVADASNIERSLYLVIQLLEMNQNAVLAMNMSDMAQARGFTIDTKALEKLLGVPVIPTAAKKGDGIPDLKKTMVNSLKNKREHPFKVPYGDKLATILKKIEGAINASDISELNIQPALAAVKIAEGDALIWKTMEGKGSYDRASAVVQEAEHKLDSELGYDLQTAIIEKRWNFISELVSKVVRKTAGAQETVTMSDRLDNILTNKWLGLPIFLVVTWLIFKLTYMLGNPASDWLDGIMGSLGDIAGGWAEAHGISSIMTSFLVDGVIGGVGSVIVFFPIIFLLFVFIAILEDSGYMSRGAFVMDRIMHLLGLHGKSFIPMLIGFGCNVPAIMGTRVLDRPRDRMITMMVIPFMSCSARLPIFALFGAAFFPAHASTMLFLLYVIGIVIAIVTAKILGSTMFKGEPSQLVMELPPYHFPTFGGVFRTAWQRGSLFLKKAGTFIFAAVVLVWVLSNLPIGVEYGSEKSYIGMIGNFIAPLFKPAGFGFWQAAVALFFGFIAKETVVGTFGTLFGVGESGIVSVLPTLFTPLSAFSFMIMALLYVPCVATIAIVKRETNSWKWPIFMTVYTTGVGWIMAIAVFQIGKILGY